MALLSDIDWVILLAVATFLLFGRGNAQVLRTLGRWYGRAGRLKQELLSEFTAAADLPSPPAGAPLSFRGALLGLEPTATHASGIPAAVTTAPGPPAPPMPPVSPSPWTATIPAPVWAMTAPVRAEEVEWTR